MKNLLLYGTKRWIYIMVDKDLKRFSRKELLEILLEQTKRIESLEKELIVLERKLNNKKISIESCGTLAEASLKLSEIFTSADEAVRIFIDNNKENVRKEEKKLRKQWESERNKLLKLTENKCKKREDACEKKINELQKEIVKLSNDLKNSKKEKNAKVKPITTSKIKPVKRVKNEKASK